jgi:hypothetical protein
MPRLAAPSTPDNAQVPLDEIARETLRGAELVGQLVELLAAEAPSRSSRALGEVLAEIDTIAFRARLLCLEGRAAALLHGKAGLAAASAEISLLADRCREAQRVLGLLQRSIEHVEARRNARLARPASLITPPAGVPTS